MAICIQILLTEIIDNENNKVTDLKLKDKVLYYECLSRRAKGQDDCIK